MPAPAFDPVFFRQIQLEHPTLWPRHREFVRVAWQRDVQELSRIDADLDRLSTARHAITRRLRVRRDELWPRLDRRRVRRPPMVDQAATPPAPARSSALYGVELRAVAVAVLGRHGVLALRELHGIIHRHGYVVGGARPVQRLADAMAYEVRQGRLVRVGRGRYSVDPAARGHRRPPAELRNDPEHWSEGRWSPLSQFGDGDPIADPSATDPDIADETVTLAEEYELIRQRLADLIDPSGDERRRRQVEAIRTTRAARGRTLGPDR